MEKETEQISQIKKTKILIVDDMPENLQVLGNTLRGKGFQIGFATNGRQALSIASVKMPDLILLDISMPDMDGLTVCKKLKEHDITNGIPIIFLTARTEMDSIKKALALGAIDYILKPFNTSDIVSRIISHLNLDKGYDQDSGAYTALMLKKSYEMLVSEFTIKWQDVRQSLFIDDVISFAEELKDLGATNKIKTIKDYAEELFKATDSLKIERMVEILGQYPAMIKKIKEKFENQ
jgi:CheY-like chemotaxis protein